MSRFSRVLLPAPVPPTTRVWPTSSSWRLSQKGVAPVVAAQSSAGLWRGKSGEGFSGRPGQTEVTGRRSARVRVEAEADAAGGVLGGSGGGVARHAGGVLVEEQLVVALAGAAAPAGRRRAGGLGGGELAQPGG